MPPNINRPNATANITDPTAYLWLEVYRRALEDIETGARDLPPLLDRYLSGPVIGRGEGHVQKWQTLNAIRRKCCSYLSARSFLLGQQGSRVELSLCAMKMVLGEEIRTDPAHKVRHLLGPLEPRFRGVLRRIDERSRAITKDLRLAQRAAKKQVQQADCQLWP